MKYVPLPTICRLRQWPTIPQKEMSGHGYPVYGANGIIGYHSEYNHERSTLFIGCRGTCGSVHLSAPKSYINGNAMCLDDLKPSYSLKFVFYFLKGYDWKKVITGTGIPQITQQGLQKVLIPEMPLEKQSAIAEALEFIDQQSFFCLKQIHLLEEQVKSLFNEMFGQPGINEKDYPMVSLGDLAKSINYGTSKPAVKDGKTPYLRMGNMTDDGRIDLSDLKYITLDGNEYEKSVVRDGDFLFNRTNSREHVGRSVAFHEKQEMIIAGYIIRVRLDKTKIEVDYLSAFMNSLYMKKNLFDMAKGAVNQANINAKEMADIKLFLPPLDLQIAFVEKKKQIDKLRFKYQRQIELLNELMEKKMEEYFGGEEDA